MITTDNLTHEDLYQLKQDPSELAKKIDTLDLTVKTVGGNRHKVAGETFRTVEEAGEFVRRLRYIASKLPK